MFPAPASPRCPWCNRALPEGPAPEECPACGQPCGERVYALDVFEGRSRPRRLVAALAGLMALLAAGLAVNAAVGGGACGDVVIFSLFAALLLIVAAAETHGLVLMSRGMAPRRLIMTAEGIEMINPHRIAGVSSIDWPEVEQLAIEPAPRGGARINVHRLGEVPRQRKAAIRTVTAATDVSPDEVQREAERLRSAG